MVMVMITKHQDESDVQDVTCKHQACVTSSPHVRYQEAHLDRTCPQLGGCSHCHDYCDGAGKGDKEDRQSVKHDLEQVD